jgi:hypothetical protein
VDGEGNKEGVCWREGGEEGVTPVTLGECESPEVGVFDSVPLREGVVLMEGVLEGEAKEVSVPPNPPSPPTSAAEVGEGLGETVRDSEVKAVGLECGRVGVGVGLPPPPGDMLGKAGEAEEEAEPPWREEVGELVEQAVNETDRVPPPLLDPVPLEEGDFVGTCEGEEEWEEDKVALVQGEEVGEADEVTPHPSTPPAVPVTVGVLEGVLVSVEVEHTESVDEGELVPPPLASAPLPVVTVGVRDTVGVEVVVRVGEWEAVMEGVPVEEGDSVPVAQPVAVIDAEGEREWVLEAVAVKLVVEDPDRVLELKGVAVGTQMLGLSRAVEVGEGETEGVVETQVPRRDADGQALEVRDLLEVTDVVQVATVGKVVLVG